MSATGKPVPPDQKARDRIAEDLDSSLLVEAGAGSGKTTSLVTRLISLIKSGAPLEAIAAVTFTRKAAAELRERFQLELEKAGMHDALVDIDRAFLGTIHAFAGRLLREHPVEAGLDPAFEEVDQLAWPGLCEAFWAGWLEELRLAGDVDLATLEGIGVQAPRLLESFNEVVKYPDVEFPFEDRPKPDHQTVRQSIDGLLANSIKLLPKGSDRADPDKLQETIALLGFTRATTDWSDIAAFAAAVESLTPSAVKPTYKAWGCSTAKEREPIKAIEAEWGAFVEGPLKAFLAAWWAYRYPILMRFLRRAAERFARERLLRGTLGFEDLLQKAVALLKSSPAVRDRLGNRWRYLLVDEFQDTDPIQAELCFLLASSASQGSEWHKVTPREGALFVVGDPKQSIYRFRRADIQTYEQVQERMAQVGGVLTLSASFRARPPVAEAINQHFDKAFPATSTEVQAANVPLLAQHAAGEGDGVFRYEVHPDGSSRDEIIQADADAVAAWIAGEIAPVGGEVKRRPGEYLILTRNRFGIAQHARALARWRIPVDTTNAELEQEAELRELVLLLRAIADPTNAVLVVAALEGRFFGCTPRDLWNARKAKASFRIDQPPAEGIPQPVGAALGRMTSWRELATQAPADVVIDRILDDSGLLALAAGEVLGEGRAGVLVRLVELVRSNDGGAALDLPAALERIETALAGEGMDVPLRPGRTGAVRVMNLHQAKGLEAHTVILAAPLKPSEREPQLHVARDQGAMAKGWLKLVDEDRTLAQPAEWEDHAAREKEFQEAEEVRLRYVAATRAAHRLVIGRAILPPLKDGGVSSKQGSPWQAFDDITSVTDTLQLGAGSPPGALELETEVDGLKARSTASSGRLATAITPTWRSRSVTERVKAPEPGAGAWREERVEAEANDLPRSRSRGASWGRCVHRVLEGTGRGRKGEALTRFIRAVVLDEHPGASSGELDALVGELETLCAKVATSKEWQSLGASPRFEVPVYRRFVEEGTEIVEEGVIDALGERGGRIQVLDWKTDASGWEAREAVYRAQATAYSDAVAELLQKPTSGDLVRLAGKEEA